ncbi:MAG: branched-chain amino acid transport system II carrier protein [Oscillibacter sp.]|nr:branched-chain amino acid transport system II carrier protein [Oscillibacter sp.]
MTTKKINAVEVLFIGLAFFANYFGAGNLVFPPMLGLQSGSSWLSGIVALAVSGIFLPILAIVIIGRAGGVTGITGHVSKNFHTILVGAIMIFAMCISTPRTASVAAELGVQGVFPEIPYVPVVVVYFLLVWFFARSKESVLDKIGKILTPAMTIILVILVIRGFVAPIGTPAAPSVEAPFLNAFLGGYQTGDVLVSFLLASLFLGTITDKGYTDPKTHNKVTFLAGGIAFICLLVVYGGLLYMGACGSSEFPADISNAELLVAVIKKSGGQLAMNALGVAVVLACLTTAVGQVTAIADFFSELSGGRLPYKYLAIVVSIVSMLIALIGLDKIIVISTPIFLATYPPCLVLMLLGMFGKFIPNDGGYKGSIALTVVYSVIEAVNSFIPMGIFQTIIDAMPLSAQGFGWILPCIVGFVLGILIYPRTAAGKTAA